ncbi:MAG: glycosyltransferase family 39 protein, partial [Anaerolineae bacterium]|nr:glycosyltransferase family 39 protein [Anaerolineae bacterium]
MHSATAEQKTRFQHYKYVLVPAVLLLGALVHVGWLARFPTDPLGPVDAEGFHLLAVNMLNGDGFAIGWEPPFCPTAIRPPLYPFLIAGCYKLLGPNPQLIVLGQILLETLTTALVIRLTSSITGLRIGLLAGLLYAINGTTQRYTGYLFAETLLLILITASLWRTVVCLRRPSLGNTALAGFLWGLTLLTKPNVQYLVLAMGGLLIFQNLLGALHFLKCVAPDFRYHWGSRPHGNSSPNSASRSRSQLIAPNPSPQLIA